MGVAVLLNFFDSQSIWAELIARFIIQLLLMLLLSRFLHFFLDKWLKEPMVISEMIAGILLGPSAFGYIPGFTDAVFPKDSLPIIKVIATSGLLLFMFVIGMELDMTVFGKNIKPALVISACGIALPFGTGMALGVWLWEYEGSATSTASHENFLIFIGVSVAITSFIALMRILRERQIFYTRIGVMVVTIAACDDVVAWCLLAFTVALVKSSDFEGAALTIVVALVYIVFCFTLLRFAIRWACRRFNLYDRMNPFLLSLLICGMFGSAWMTLQIGIHEIFGAFIFGLILPREHNFTHNITKRIEELVIVFLLPLYFTQTGLNVNISTLDDGKAWGVTIGVTVAAICSKVFGCGIPSYFLTSLNFRECTVVGFLVSTRGLTELIVLNIGYSLGVINQKLLTMMVLMALATTFITSPLMAIIHPPEKMFLRERANFLRGSEFSMMLSIADKVQALRLVSFTKRWIALHPKNLVYALHLVKGDERPSTYLNWGDIAEEEEMENIPSADDNDDEERKEAEEHDDNQTTDAAESDVETGTEDNNQQQDILETVWQVWIKRMKNWWVTFWSLVRYRRLPRDEVDPVAEATKDAARLCRLNRVSVIRKASPEFAKDISTISNAKKCDLILLGPGKAIEESPKKNKKNKNKKKGNSETGMVEKLLFGGVAGYMLRHAKHTNVGILINDGNQETADLLPSPDDTIRPRHVLIPYYGGERDIVSIRMARKFMKESLNIFVTILRLRAIQGKKKGRIARRVTNHWAKLKKKPANQMQGWKDVLTTSTTNLLTRSGSTVTPRNADQEAQQPEEEGGGRDTEEGGEEAHEEKQQEKGVEDEDSSDDSSEYVSDEEVKEMEGLDDLEDGNFNDRRRGLSKLRRKRMPKRLESPEAKEERERLVHLYKRDKLLAAVLKRPGARIVDVEGDEKEEGREGEEIAAIRKELGANDFKYELLVIGVGKKLRNVETLEYLLQEKPVPQMLLVRQQNFWGVADVDSMVKDSETIVSLDEES